MTRGITDNSVVYEYLFLATRKMFDLTSDLTQPKQWQKVTSPILKIQTSIRPSSFQTVKKPKPTR